MVQGVKVFRQVQCYRMGVSLLRILFHLLNGVLRTSSRAITVTVLREQRPVDRCKALCYGLLENAVLISSFWFSLRYAPISSTVIPSIPGAPLFAFTLLKALLRLPFSSISSKSSGCALSLSFHIRRKERCAPTYPSHSALSLCGQLSLFSVPKALSSFPGCTKDSC